MFNAPDQCVSMYTRQQGEKKGWLWEPIPPLCGRLRQKAPWGHRRSKQQYPLAWRKRHHRIFYSQTRHVHSPQVRSLCFLCLKTFLINLKFLCHKNIFSDHHRNKLEINTKKKVSGKFAGIWKSNNTSKGLNKEPTRKERKYCSEQIQNSTRRTERGRVAEYEGVLRLHANACMEMAQCKTTINNNNNNHHHHHQNPL